ncbi:MAG TPA: hydroxyphenylacetyl-CoA thioesterase PaaI [Micromonosporaceae bacterium]|nr:hydroxyphenylacetyl-CoA thioesterase PaaI [Micromonosporaceae bacterium]
MHERDLTSQSLGIQLDDVTPGRAKVHMRIAETMVNQHEIAHGGFIFLLADAAFAYACNSYGPVAVAQSAEVTFLQPAFAGDELHAEAVERARFGRNGIYDVAVRDTKGELIAEFRGHSVVLAAKPLGGQGE